MKKGDKCIYFTFDTMQRQISLIEQLKLILYVKPNLILIVPSKTHTQMATQTYRKTEKKRHRSKTKEKKKKEWETSEEQSARTSETSTTPNLFLSPQVPSPTRLAGHATHHPNRAETKRLILKVASEAKNEPRRLADDLWQLGE